MEDNCLTVEDIRDAVKLLEEVNSKIMSVEEMRRLLQVNTNTLKWLADVKSGADMRKENHEPED